MEHAYLLISRKESSMVLQTGQVRIIILELDHNNISRLFFWPVIYADWIVYNCFDIKYSKKQKQESVDHEISKCVNQEINELDSSGFRTTEPTIFAGNIGGNSHIVQGTGGK